MEGGKPDVRPARGGRARGPGGRLGACTALVTAGRPCRGGCLRLRRGAPAVVPGASAVVPGHRAQRRRGGRRGRGLHRCLLHRGRLQPGRRRGRRHRRGAVVGAGGPRRRSGGLARYARGVLDAGRADGAALVAARHAGGGRCPRNRRRQERWRRRVGAGARARLGRRRTRTGNRSPGEVLDVARAIGERGRPGARARHRRDRASPTRRASSPTRVKRSRWPRSTATPSCSVSAAPT